MAPKHEGGMRLSMAHLSAMQHKLKSVQAHADRVKHKADGLVSAAVDTTLVVGSGYVAGLIQGRTGGVMLPGGIPLELAFGVAGLGAAMMGIGGPHTKSVGDGFLTAHFLTVGRGQGRRALDRVNQERARQGLPPTGEGVHLLEGKKEERPAPSRPGAKDQSAGRVR